MAKPRNILIVHQNFPGQFPHIADMLAARGDRVVTLGGSTAKARGKMPLFRWSAARGTTPGIFDPATRAEADLIRADAAARVAAQLAAKGYKPDLIVGHPGWGETIHLQEIWPKAKLILFGEFFYRSRGADVGFDAEFEKPGLAADMRVHAKNATGALAYAAADRIVCPTPFQASTFPVGLRHRISVVHEGLDLHRARRRPEASLALLDGRVLKPGDPVITYLSRNLERMRGFHIFMRALPEFLRDCPDAQVVVIGADTGAGYAGALPQGETWKRKMLAELGSRLDLSRVHFVGKVTHERMIDAFSVSAGHVYYTYPFVLSWSLVEAMGCECLIIGSDTPPLRDAVEPGMNGVLHPFFDIKALSRAMTDAIREPERFAAMRTAARETALARFDRSTVGLPAWLRIIDEVLAG